MAMLDQDLLREVLTFRIYLLTKLEPSECGEQGKGVARFPSLSPLSQGHCVFAAVSMFPSAIMVWASGDRWGKDRAR